ncbi:MULTISPECIES: hypothetical protein [Exiguobacterium]|uniref:hypothetical protein n=1 Tax=Exiguobacterium TaxID=33986 RepID=UPI001BECE947|nr:MULTISPECIES: hypothetical protein [Exiguobacterium]MCT4782318.1 hypothetical protein [Exiguobacterium himgiriensis]
MTRSYAIVLLAVFGLFFLQLYGRQLPYATLLSILLLGVIIIATVLKWRQANH